VPSAGASPPFDAASRSVVQFRITVCCIIVAIGALLYGHTLSFPFVFDDILYLVHNPLVKEGRSFTFHGDISTFANYAVKNGLERDISTNFILRPVSYLTFHLNFLLDGMNPRGFRAVNILIHCTNAMLLFLVLSHLLSASRAGMSMSAFSARFIPAGSSLLFLVHPLQVESVTYIVQRFTSLGTLFYLLTILAHLLSLAAAARNTRLVWRSVSVAGLVLGMLTKEIVFTAPCMIVILDRVLMGTPLKIAIKRAWVHLLCLPLIPILIILTSVAQNGGSLSLAAVVNIDNENPPPGYQYFYALTQLSVVLTYLRMIIAPYGLNLDPDYPLSTSLFEARVVVSVIITAAIVAGCWFWHRRRQGDGRITLMASMVAWYFVTLGIDSSIVPLPDVMAEHRSYLPSIGAITALVCCADWLRTRLVSAHAVRLGIQSLVAVWIVALGGGTYARNNVWRSEISLWKDSVSKSANKSRPWFNLAGAYHSGRLLQEAAECTRKVIELEPGWKEAHVNLAAIENQLGNYQAALAACQAGLANTRDDCNLYFNMGFSYGRLGDLEQSIQSFKKAIAIRSDHRPSRLNLASIYTHQKKYHEALAHLNVAASLQPLEPPFQQIASEAESAIRQHDTPVTVAAQ
jgi:tetratricopeptide (TPR) repeat protein